MNSALLVIDMINDFLLPGAPLEVPMGRDIINNIVKEIDIAHSIGRSVIFISDEHYPDDEEFKVWPKHALYNSSGRLIHKAFMSDMRPVESITKGTYSGFLRTELSELLESEIGVPMEVLITGILTNVCVFITAIEAQMRGYKVSIIRDCVATLSQKSNDRALSDLENTFKVSII